MVFKLSRLSGGHQGGPRTASPPLPAGVLDPPSQIAYQDERSDGNEQIRRSMPDGVNRFLAGALRAEEAAHSAPG